MLTRALFEAALDNLALDWYIRHQRGAKLGRARCADGCLITEFLRFTLQAFAVTDITVGLDDASCVTGGQFLCVPLTQRMQRFVRYLDAAYPRGGQIKRRTAINCWEAM